VGLKKLSSNLQHFENNKFWKRCLFILFYSIFFKQNKKVLIVKWMWNLTRLRHWNSYLDLIVLHVLLGNTLWRHVNNTLNVCTALTTELKILVFGFIFLVRPFSLILDSFHNIIRQKIVFYLSDFLNKMAPSMYRFEKRQGVNKNGECIA
jgi:hypothetical protein